MTKEDSIDEHAQMSPAEGQKSHPSQPVRFHSDGAGSNPSVQSVDIKRYLRDTLADATAPTKPPAPPHP